jgi:CVNH domain
MNRILLGLAAAVSLAGTALSPVSAQGVPAGSYQQSCTNIRVRGDQLVARCNLPQGGTVRSSISLNSCRGDIANVNGQLTCRNGNGYGYGRGHRDRDDRNNGNGNGHRDRDDRGNGNGNGYGNNGYGNNGYGNGYAPGGSYQGSCTNVQMNGSTLTASCTAPNGNRITSSINASQCRGADIANINGRLACR